VPPNSGAYQVCQQCHTFLIANQVAQSCVNVVIMLLCVIACSGSSAQTARPLDQSKIERLLVEIRSFTDRDNQFFGDGSVLALRDRLASLDMQTAPGPFTQTLLKLGIAEVDYGNLEAGIQRLLEAYKLIAQLDAPNSARAQVIAALGVAYLRLAETENCCALHAPESCIVPLRGAALHTNRRGSEAAIKYFEEVIRMKEVDPSIKLSCVWLMNIAYMTLGDYPAKVPRGMGIPTSTFESKISFPRFENVSVKLGLDRFGLAGGAVMDDFDGDNDIDLVTSCWDTAEPLSYSENVGNGKFEDRTEASGLKHMLGGLNLIHADYDNDGDLDLYVLRGAWMAARGRHPNSLLQNQGNGTFIDRTFESGLGHEHFPTQTAAWADYDNDGDLDLYVGNETDPSFAAPCQLFQNLGDGTFVDVAAKAGVTNDRYTKGVVWGDVDGDRWPDLIVSNIDLENRLYRNQGDGTFIDTAKAAGVALPLRSFPVWTWDFNNDGMLDVFISSYEGTVVEFVLHCIGKPVKGGLAGHYMGNGRGQFTNVAKAQGLTSPMLPMGANYGDLNNDGYLDFYLGTGEPMISEILPNMMYLNNRGEQFIDVTMAGGFGHLQKGHGIAFADFDEDGDQDIFQQMGGAKRVDKYRDALYQNPGFGSGWLKVKLVGKTSNRSGIGARIKATIKEGQSERSIYRHVGSGSSFGGNPFRQHIGIGKATEVARLEVYWPTTDKTQVFENIAVNQMIEVSEAEEKFRVLQGP
jgi:hypothetical protein